MKRPALRLALLAAGCLAASAGLLATLGHADIRPVTNAASSGVLPAGSVGTAEIADGAIDTSKLGSGAVTASKYGALSIYAGAIGAGAVDTSKLGSGAVDTTKILSGAVDTRAILSGAVNSAAVQASAILTVHINNGAVDTTKLGSGAVDTTKILSGAVDTRAILSGAVNSAALQASSVITAAINNGAVDTNKLGSGAVDTTKIKSGAVDTRAILTDAVTANAILAGAVDTNKIGSGAVNTPAFKAGATAPLATALAANGANCSAGNYPLGVDASGASESCTAAPSTPVGFASATITNAQTSIGTNWTTVTGSSVAVSIQHTNAYLQCAANPFLVGSSSLEIIQFRFVCNTGTDYIYSGAAGTYPGDCVWRDESTNSRDTCPMNAVMNKVYSTGTTTCHVEARTDSSTFDLTNNLDSMQIWCKEIDRNGT